MRNKFALRLQELRAEKNMTQRELAEKIGVLVRTVSYLESGRRECDFDTLLRIAEFFDVTCDYLLGKVDY